MALLGERPGGLAKPVEGLRPGTAAQPAGALLAHPDRLGRPPAMARSGELEDVGILPLGRPTVAAGAHRHGREFGRRARQIGHGHIRTYIERFGKPWVGADSPGCNAPSCVCLFMLTLSTLCLS